MFVLNKQSHLADNDDEYREKRTIVTRGQSISATTYPQERKDENITHVLRIQYVVRLETHNKLPDG